MIKIGHIYSISLPYYDMKKRCMSFKKRPALIIGKADTSDYVTLPVSRVTNRQYISTTYDYKLDVNEYQLTNLKVTSYVRTHKQTIVEVTNIGQDICDFAKEYGVAYTEILHLVKVFQDSIQNSNEYLFKNRL